MLSSLGNLFLKLLGGTRNERLVRAKMALVRQTITPLSEALQEEYVGLVRQMAESVGLDAEDTVRQAAELKLAPLSTREWLQGKAAALRQRLADGQTPRDVLPEAFALIRFASWMARDHRQFDVQLVAGQVLYENAIAEEATGEGKTIACYPAIFLTVLEGKRVHVVTVNDYLVERDADFARLVFDLVGMKVGAIQQPMDNAQRQVQYACDVIYGTNSEFGFDYLRDNMKLSIADQVQGRLDYAIVDEVDSILIDEARTPLIISGPAYGNVDRYRKADTVAREIISRHRPYEQANQRVEAIKRNIKTLEGEVGRASGGQKASMAKRLEQTRVELTGAEEELGRHTKYYQVELDKKSAHLTHEGIGVAQEIAGVGSFYVGANMEWPHLMEQSLRAHVVYERDKDYVVRTGEVVIVDEFTGRLMEGRQWSDGLHQAVEAKERVTVKEENQTMATITFQNFFKLYGKLAGMTGTAMTEAEEFMKIYKLDVVTIPTHRPVNRVDHHDRIYGTVEEKYDALVEEINHHSKKGRPVLVGTTSIEKSDHLSDMLTRRYGIVHEVLNARPENAHREADIVALAGQRRPLKRNSDEMVGNVTIATNMAGRGTDIKLGVGVVWANCKVLSLEKFRELGVQSESLFPPGSTKCCIHCQQYDSKTDCAHCFKPKLDTEFPRRGRTDCRGDVPCGLHIIGTERHEARRIDNQLRGRSGRQGDPGSSRFFLSLRDDLMVIFGADRVLRLLQWVGLKSGEPIEHRSVSRAISNVQKKVEQRNFDIRKNLLEYDEVMDHQRKYFYSRRQRLLAGLDVQETIRTMIEETIVDAVANYLSGDYVRRTIAEWVRQNLEINVSAEGIRADSSADLPHLEQSFRNRAKEEAAGTINMTIAEYIDPEADRKEWDLKGLTAWAMSRFRVNISQNQVRDMDPQDIERMLVGLAQEHIDQVDLSGLGQYLEAGYAPRALAEWARSKFGVQVPVEKLIVEDSVDAEQAIRAAVEITYSRREIEYPPEYAVDVTIGQAGAENTYAQAALCEWANGKYEAGWTAEGMAGRGGSDILKDLVAMSDAWLTGGKLAAAVDAFLANPDAAARDKVVAWARQRFDTKLSDEQLAEGELRDVLVKTGRDFLRRELTELERFVLLQIYDSSWKDHLLAMDHLKSSVGLRSFAEQDPKIAFKKEGFRLFQEMLAGVQQKVTDIVFKARLAAPGASASSVYQISHMVHEQLSGYDHLAQDMSNQRAAAAPQKVQQIVREEPKIGRNDPCPCGSGKKYKKCHGKM